MKLQDDLLEYYRRELAYLRVQGGDFAARYPKVAQRLDLSEGESADPHTERLIESVAFLTARIHRDLDRQFPDVATSLLENLCPSLTQPVAAMTVVQMTPDPTEGKITAGLRVPRGTSLTTTADTGETCRMRTAWDLTLWPLRMAGVHLEDPRTLRLDLRCEEGLKAIQSAESIDAHRFSKGESAALAIEAVTRLMREQGRSKRSAALRQTASATAQTLISVIPGAQVAGSGASLASALIELLILFKEFMEDKATRDAMNRYLANVVDPDTAGSTVDDIETGRELFAKFPLLGAYWVMIADTSSVIGICAEDLTAANFMQQVERISRTHMEELRSAAADLIAESSLVIPELSAHRLIVAAQSATPYSTTWSSMTESIKRSVRGWSIHKRASGVFPPPAWKGRVIGVGSDEYFAAQEAQGAR